MAQRTEIQLIDDLDGSPADTTVRFGVDGTAYEIDLSDAHAQELREAFQPYVDVARRTSGAGRRPARTRGGDQPSPSTVRAWARSEGIEVSDRGRVPAELIVRFKSAE